MKKKILSFAGLALGFAVGQGSVLLVYSYLIAVGSYELVVFGGIALASFSLLQQIIDYGGFLFLTRVAIKIKSRDKSKNYGHQLFTSLLIIRILTLIILIILGISVKFILEIGGFTFWSMVGIVPGLAAWCFNQQGRMDAFNKAGVAGMLNALPWLLSALAMLLFEGRSPLPSGLLLGGAYSFGLILAAGAHAGILSRMGVGLKLISPRKIQVRLVASLGGAILMAWLPGQLLARVQLALSGHFPANLSSGFVFGRNMLNASTSIQFMINRIEFPVVCAKLNDVDRRLSIKEALIFHRVGIGFGVVSSIAMAMAPLLPLILPSSTLITKFQYSSQVMLMLSPLALITSINSSLSQTLHAFGESKKLLLHNYVAAAMGIFICTFLYKSLGVLGLLLGSLVSAIIQFSGCALVIYRR